jgi:lysozyme
MEGSMSDLITQLKRHEGLRLKPYQCTADKMTIGYGRNLDDVGISQAEAETLLTNDIARAETQLLKALPWVKQLTQTRREVLINMAFNLGIVGLLKFKNTLGHIRAGRYASAAQEMLKSRWALQVGKRANELAEQMRTGKYAS